MTRQLFPSPSQGALICAGGGRRGGWRRQDPLHTRASRLAASHFPPRLLDPWGDPPPAGRAEPAGGDDARLSVRETALPGVGWAAAGAAGGLLLLVCAGRASSNQGARPGCCGGQAALPGTGRRQNLDLVARGLGGSVCGRVCVLVVVLPGSSTPVLGPASPRSFEGAWSGPGRLCPSGDLARQGLLVSVLGRGSLGPTDRLWRRASGGRMPLLGTSDSRLVVTRRAFARWVGPKYTEALGWRSRKGWAIPGLQL